MNMLWQETPAIAAHTKQLLSANSQLHWLFLGSQQRYKAWFWCQSVLHVLMELLLPAHSA